MEAAIFALIIVWMIKVWIGGSARINVPCEDLRRLALPSISLALFFLSQLAPMPTRILRAVTPRTFRIYVVSFPSWPALPPYQGLGAIWTRSHSGTREGALLPVAPSNPGAIRPAASQSRRNPAQALPRGIDGMRWRTLSLSPAVSASATLEWLAMGALGFLILLYPVGLVGEHDAEKRFRLTIMIAMIGAAAIVALVGLAERTWWNGKLLWFYIPLDWGAPLMEGATRASGPFVDPDHFANYLVMALPLALIGAIFGLPGSRRRRDSDLKLFCAVACCLLLAGVALSLSRGGWMAMAAGISAAILMSMTRAREEAPTFMRRISLRAVPLTIVSLALLLGLVLFLIGPNGRAQTGERVGSTIVEGDSLQYRPAVWRDTLSMIADFPAFGVGLGVWPDVFPHYQRPPWMPFFFREAENDYLQFVAETGFVGLALLLWLGAALSRLLWRAAKNLPRRRWPAFAGLVAGVGAALLHEAVDFSFHMPANALLFTVTLALCLRIALMDGRAAPARAFAASSGKTRTMAALAAAVAAVLIAGIFFQNGAVYPYHLDRPRNLARAEANVTAHPAAALAHFALARMIVSNANEAAALRQRELASAVWLDPNDPIARDLYARTLMTAGDNRAGLRQISSSVYRAPDLDVHYYLEPGLIPWLLPREQAAIADGFERAIRRGFSGAVDALGAFYLDLGRYRAAARVYSAAAASSSAAARMDYLLKAGGAFAKSQDVASAAEMFDQAARIDPSDPRPYTKLAGDILEPARDAAGAKAAIAVGMRRGADAYTLESALADAAWRAGDLPTAEYALTRALKIDSTFAATMSLGQVYLAENRTVRAVLEYQQATEINPASSDAYFALAQAQERDFEYFEAEKSYARAIFLAPHDSYKRRAFMDFQERTAKSARQAESSVARAAGGKRPGHAPNSAPAQISQ